MDNMTDETQNGPQPSTSDPGNQLPVGEGANGTAPVEQPAPPPRTVSVQPPPVSPNPVTGGPQINGSGGQPPKPLYHDQGEKSTDDPRDFHPSVQSASVLRRVAETLAGGPRIKTSIDPNTGETTRTPVPLTTRQVLLGAVANILGGAGQIAGNLSNRMEGRAPNPVQPLPTQQAAQKQAEQSEEDFNQVQQQKLRKAKIMEANMNAYRASLAAGKEADEAKDQMAANHANELEEWNKAGVVVADHVAAPDVMKKGYKTSQYLAIPDGHVPAYDDNGKRVVDKDGVPMSHITYSIVDGTKANSQIPLTQDKYSQLAKYGLMSAKEGYQLPEGATISAAAAALMNHKLDLIDQTQRELDRVHDAVGGEKVNLAAQIKKNSQLLPAIETFHNDGASTEPDNQINNLNASQDPKVRSAAGLMRTLFGNDNLEKYKQNRIDTDAASKTAANEKARLAAEEASPKYQQQLKNEKLTAQKEQLEINKLQKDQQADLPTGQVVNGIDKKAMASLPVPEQRAAQMIMDGRMELSPQTLRTAFGASWPTKLATLFPGDATHEGFDSSKAKAYEKLRQDYTSGKAFQRIQASDNALGHLNQYLHASQSLATTAPGASTLAEYGLFGKNAQQLAKNREAAIEFISEETAKATKGGVPDKDEVKRIRSILTGYTPSNSAAGAQAVAKILKTPIDELQSGWESGVPFGAVSPLTHLMSPEAQHAYKNLTGETPKWVGRPREPQQQTGGGSELIQNESKQSGSPGEKPPQSRFTATSSDGLWGWNGSQWVSTGIQSK